MTPNLRDELDDLDGEFAERRSSVPPERINRPASGGAKQRPRRSRPNDAAKRGMHQRRKKRIAW
jgi:hypothetical protein